MNYRHLFHAGNFGDVFKHALLVALLRAMQRKDKGFVFVDTHAGIADYDFTAAPPGRTLEYQGGIARLWSAQELPESLREFVDLVRRHNLERGGTAEQLRHYPGSPCLAALLRRPQDRLALSELHPDDFATLRQAFARQAGVSVQCIDAYSALRAHLPPPERRALVLIDPPYEDANEVSRLYEGLEAGLQRLPAGTFVVWYPIKEHSAVEAFKSLLLTLPLPPTLVVELTIQPDDRADRLNGCGLVVLNPPWQIDAQFTAIAEALRPRLALAPGARASLEWLVPES